MWSGCVCRHGGGRIYVIFGGGFIFWRTDLVPFRRMNHLKRKEIGHKPLRMDLASSFSASQLWKSCHFLFSKYSTKQSRPLNCMKKMTETVLSTLNNFKHRAPSWPTDLSTLEIMWIIILNCMNFFSGMHKFWNHVNNLESACTLPYDFIISWTLILKYISILSNTNNYFESSGQLFLTICT